MAFTDFIVRNILFLMNVLIIAIGLVMTVVGSILIHYTRILNEEVDIRNVTDVWILMTVIGCIVFTIALFGCSGAVGGQPFLLNSYGVLLVLISVVKMVIVVKVYKVLSETETAFENRLYGVFEDPERRQNFFIVEVIFHCCGPSGAASYKVANLDIPPNCCPSFNIPPITSVDDILTVGDMITNYNGTQCTSAEAYEGCTKVALSSVYRFYIAIAGTGLILITIELVAMISAFYLAQYYRNVKEDILSRSCTFNRRAY